MGRLDLLAPQRVERRQRGRVERRENELVAGLTVEELGAHEALRGRREDQVVQRLLEPEGLRGELLIAIAAVVDGESEAIALGRIREVEVTDFGGKFGSNAFLQAQRVEVGGLRKLDELFHCPVLAEVVTDDSDHVTCIPSQTKTPAYVAQEVFDVITGYDGPGCSISGRGARESETSRGRAARPPSRRDRRRRSPAQCPRGRER